MSEYYAIEQSKVTNPLGSDRLGSQIPAKGMIITDYGTEYVKAREMDSIHRCQGNAYLKEPGLYCLLRAINPVKYKDRRAAVHVQRQILFRPTSVRKTENRTSPRACHLRICDRETINAPYREIAKTADVALGTVGWVIRNLKEQGLLVERKKGKRRRLVDRKKLLNKWVEAYNEKLRPTLIIGRYTAPQDYWWRNIDIGNYGARWGGEVAAAKLTGYLKPEVATIYAKEMPVQLMRDFKMRNDPKGNVEIMRQFWDDRFNPDDQKRENKYIDIAPVIIVYADLHNRR
jgi:hypothetical protein